MRGSWCAGVAQRTSKVRMVGIADGLDASAKHPLCSPVEFNSKQCPPSNVRRLYKTITAVTLSQIFLSSIIFPDET